MFNVKSIEYKNDNILLIIDTLNDKIYYNNLKKTVNNELIFNYLKKFFRIIDDWKKEYIDYNYIDGNNWNLTINYINNEKKEYYGKLCFPKNFETFENLNQEMIKEVLNG